MPYNLNEFGFMNKYNDIKALIDVEVSPLIDILFKLSNICNNFSSTANRIANIDIRETHEIKEFLELTFDARKLAQKVEEVVEFRAEVAIEAAKCCYYESIPHKEDQEGHGKDIDAIIAAGNRFVNKNVTTNKGNEKNQGKKDGKNAGEDVKEKQEKGDKEEVKQKDANPKEKASGGNDKDKKETGKKDQE